MSRTKFGDDAEGLKDPLVLLGWLTLPDVLVVAPADLEARGDDPRARLEAVAARADGRPEVHLEPEAGGLVVNFPVGSGELLDGLVDELGRARLE